MLSAITFAPCIVFVFILILPERWVDETWERTNKVMLFLSTPTLIYQNKMLLTCSMTFLFARSSAISYSSLYRTACLPMADASTLLSDMLGFSLRCHKPCFIHSNFNWMCLKMSGDLKLGRSNGDQQRGVLLLPTHCEILVTKKQQLMENEELNHPAQKEQNWHIRV